MIDFIVAGVVKGGTTSVHHYLKQHPQVQVSKMLWTRFFHVDGVEPDFRIRAELYGYQLLNDSLRRFRMMCHAGIARDFSKYLENWDYDKEGVVRGEVSPTYLHDPDVYKRIKKRFPEIKIIVVLREPVSRAYSHFIMDLRYGWLGERNLIACFNREPLKIDDFWWGLTHHIRHGFYTKRLKEMLRIFGRDNVKVLLHDHLQADPRLFMRDVYEFIGVDQEFQTDTSARHNEGLLLRSDGSREKPPDLPDRIRTSLGKYYQPDVEELQELLDLDLSLWY